MIARVFCTCLALSSVLTMGAPRSGAAQSTPDANAAATDASGSGERKGLLGGFLQARPRTPKPWHKWGEFYYGAGVGASLYNDHTESNDDGSLSNIDASDTGFEWNVRGGFAGKYVGVELGWMDLGQSKFDAVSDGTGNSWSPGDVSAEVDVNGWTLSGLVRVPIKERWVMLARIGVMGWTSTETFTETNGGPTVTTVEEDTGTTALYGVGFEYDIYNLNHFWIVTEFTRAQVDEDELPVNVISGSIVYHY